MVQSRTSAGAATADGRRTSTLQIRSATEADVGELRPLWDAFTAEATFTPYPPAGFSSSLVREHTGLVAQDEGSIIGTLYLNTQNPGFGFVFGVYVVPEARLSGVARSLMREAARILRDQGTQYLVLGVDTDNHAARALYERLGFVDAARTLRASVDDLLED